MSWIKVNLRCSPTHCETIEDVFLANHAISISYYPAVEGNNQSTQHGSSDPFSSCEISGLFPGSVSTSPILKRLDEYYFASRIERFADCNWEMESRKSFHPIEIEGCLTIMPPWYETQSGATLNLVINPGQGFGIGSHPSTYLCLQRLCKLPLQGKYLMDYGCGSGILAIASLLLGAKGVHAVDCDKKALANARENARLNSIMGNRLTLALPEECQETDCFDLVVANILSNTLISLTGRLSRLVRPQGYLLLSGILQSQAELVRSHYSYGFNFNRYDRDEWCLLEGVKKTN